MSRLIAIVACTRPNLVGRMVESLHDCDEVRVGFDPTRLGQAITRNALLKGIEDDDVVRVCDDDDIACNSRELWQDFSTQADALLFSYELNGRVVRVPDDPWLAATDFVISCNWMVRGRLLKKLGGQLFDPRRTINTGTWAWLRILQTTPLVQVEPALVGYRYFKRHDSVSCQGLPDPELFAYLRMKFSDNPDALSVIALRENRHHVPHTRAVHY